MEQKFNWTLAFEEAHNGNKKLLDKYLENAYHTILIPFISKKAKSISDAEEIASQAITKFWERFYILQEPLPKNVNGYLYTIGVNTQFYYYKMKNKLKKREVNLDMNDLSQAFTSQLIDNSDLEEQEGKELLFEAIERGLNKMCDTCRALLKLNIFENKKLKDIYESLGIPTANAASKKKIKCINKLIKYAYKELHV